MDDSDVWWQAALAATPLSGCALSTSGTRRLGWRFVHDAAVAGDDTALALAAGQGFVLTHAQTRELGRSPADVRRLVRRGEWTSPRRGILCPLPAEVAGRPGGTSPEIAVAAAALARTGCVISHQSAALLHGMAVLRPTPRVRLTVERASRAGGWPDCHIHAARLPEQEIAHWFGVPITSAARTIVDIARHDGERAGLVVADSGLTEGVVTGEEIRDSVRRARRRPGVVAAARVAELATEGAESPLESLTRLCLLDGGIQARIRLQVPVETRRGVFRLDLLIGENVIVEADGRTKYTSVDALWQEKRRQESLEQAGFIVVRVTWQDVMAEPRRTVERVLAALDRADLLRQPRTFARA